MERKPLFSIPGESGPLRARRSRGPSRLHSGLAYIFPSQNRRLSSSPSVHKVTTMFLQSATPCEKGPSESHRAGSGGKRAASSEGWAVTHDFQNKLRPTSPPRLVRRTPSTGGSRLSPRKSPSPVRIEAVPDDLAASIESRRHDRLPSSLRNDELESHPSFFAALL